MNNDRIVCCGRCGRYRPRYRMDDVFYGWVGELVRIKVFVCKEHVIHRDLTKEEIRDFGSSIR